MTRSDFGGLRRVAATATLAVAMVAGSSVLAFAQPGDPAYQQQAQDYQAKQQQYQDQQQNYSDQRDDYQAQRDAYARQRAGYRDRREAYDAQRSDYEAARADYDARYGAGAVDRYTRDHVTTTTTYGPAGRVEERTTVVQSPY
jgi:hypothetical protein